MSVTTLEERRKKILELVVRCYIDTAVPVASWMVCERSRLGLSSATVRHCLAELEELGYLWQPHTSGGRIPTDRGYRCYVDTLMEVERLSPSEEDDVAQAYGARHERFEDVMEATCDILAALTNCASAVLYPSLDRSALKHVKLIGLEGGRCLAVLLTASGDVRHALVDLPGGRASQEELNRVANLLNYEFEGHPSAAVAQALERRLLEESDRSFFVVRWAREVIHALRTAEEADRRLFVRGASNVLAQPEFREGDRFRQLLRAFEQKTGLLQLLSQDLDREGCRISIGTEHADAEIQACSVVVSNYKVHRHAVGSLGVVGPTRMAYAHVVSAVQYLADRVGQILTEMEE